MRRAWPSGSLRAALSAWLVVLLAFTAPLRAAAPVQIDPRSGHQPLGLHLDYLEDRDGRWTLAQVRAPELAQRFQPSRVATPNFGFTHSTYWLRFTLHSTAAERAVHLLVLGYPPAEPLGLTS